MDIHAPIKQPRRASELPISSRDWGRLLNSSSAALTVVASVAGWLPRQYSRSMQWSRALTPLESQSQSGVPSVMSGSRTIR